MDQESIEQGLETIVAARAGDIDAFERLVLRHQAQAQGYARSVLRDFHLAQDAVQSAFIEAYRKLPDLRDPRAFPAWFRRIVFKYCDRLTRGARLPTVPLHLAEEQPSRQAAPDAVHEERELAQAVLQAIRELPRGQRAPASLFYIDGRSQKQVAELIDHYARRKHGAEDALAPHPLLEPALARTFGIVVFQEQVIAAAASVAGFSLERADLCRRTLQRGGQQQKAELREAFVHGARAQGMAADDAAAAFEAMEEHAPTTFNRAHAVTYARLAYRAAYLKMHFPREFTVACLNTYRDEKSVVDRLLAEVEECGPTVAGPDINGSGIECTVDCETVGLGLSVIARCPLSLARAAVEERSRTGGFTDLFDVAGRLIAHGLTTGSLAALIADGALDSLPGTKAMKLASVGQALRFARQRERPGTSVSPPPELSEHIDSLDLVREIAASCGRAVKDMSFDVYCPGTYAHHFRMTLWVPRDTVIYELDAPTLLQQARAVAASFAPARNEDYVIGLNSRLDQYGDRHPMSTKLAWIAQRPQYVQVS